MTGDEKREKEMKRHAQSPRPFAPSFFLLLVVVVGVVSLLPSLASAASSSWTFGSAKLEIGGSPHAFTPSSTPLEVVLKPEDKVKLTLTCKLDDLARKPHQAMLLVRNTETGLEANLNIVVKSNGRGTTGFAYADLSPHLTSAGTVSLTLVVAGQGDVTPLLHDLARLVLETDGGSGAVDSKSVVPTPVMRYGALPEITHTFRPDQKMPPVVVSLFFSVVVIGGLVALVGAWIAAGANLDGIGAAYTKSPVAYTLFLCTLVGIEALFLLFWAQLRIMSVLGCLGLMSVPAFFSGRFALRDVEARRKAGTR